MQNDYGEGRKLNAASHLTKTSLTRSLFLFFFHLNLWLLVFIAACALRPLEEAETRLSRGARHLLSAIFPRCWKSRGRNAAIFHRVTDEQLMCDYRLDSAGARARVTFLDLRVRRELAAFMQR